MHRLTIDEKAALSLKGSMVRGFGARKEKGEILQLKYNFQNEEVTKKEKNCVGTQSVLSSYKRFKSTSN